MKKHIPIPICLLALFLSTSVAQNVTTLDLPLPSQSEPAQIVYAVFEGLGFFGERDSQSSTSTSTSTEKQLNGTSCETALIDATDQVLYLIQNVTLTGEQPFANLGPYLNISAFIADSLARTALHCPVAMYGHVINKVKHWDQFLNATAEEIAESFMFSLLSKSMTYRGNYFNIQNYAENNNTAGLVRECLSIAMDLAFFSNVYTNSTAHFLNESTTEISTSQQQDLSQNDYIYSGQEPLSLASYDSKPYKLLIELFSRFADFLGSWSHTYHCSETLLSIEHSCLLLAASEQLSVGSVSVHLSKILSQMHTLLYSCSYGAITELGVPHTYVSFNTTEEVFETLDNFFIQDKRIYLDFVNIYGLIVGLNESPPTVQAHMVEDARSLFYEKQMPGVSLASIETINYSEIGFYFGDAIARLILRGI